MKLTNLDVGDDPIVQSYVGTPLIRGQYRRHSCKMGSRIDTWYDFFPFDKFGWTNEVLIFKTKLQMDNFAKLWHIELTDSSYY